jgi:hypothetical protein
VDEEIKKQFARLLALLLSARSPAAKISRTASEGDYHRMRNKSDLTFIASLKSAIHLDSHSLDDKSERLKHNKRLHNAQFINHTARTMERSIEDFLILGFAGALPVRHVQHVFSLCFSTLPNINFPHNPPRRFVCLERISSGTGRRRMFGFSGVIVVFWAEDS